MISAFEELGMADLAERSGEVFALNFPDADPKRQSRRDWWPFW